MPAFASHILSQTFQSQRMKALVFEKPQFFIDGLANFDPLFEMAAVLTAYCFDECD
jgi:hypothetical protein